MRGEWYFLLTPLSAKWAGTGYYCDGREAGSGSTSHERTCATQKSVRRHQVWATLRLIRWAARRKPDTIYRQTNGRV